MASSPVLTLHVLPFSHPAMAAEKALRVKGLEFERVQLMPGAHVEEIQKLYGEQAKTVPGLLVDGEPVHSSSAIYAKLDEIEPDPPLLGDDRVREAERWGDEHFQDAGRRLSFGALHFRPESMGTLTGVDELDPAGTDFAIKYIRQAWRYHGLSAELLAAELAALPEKFDHIDGLIADGVIGGATPNAADLQIGSTLRVLLIIGDVRPLIEGRPLERLARDHFADYPGDIPAGAFPKSWVPSRPTP
jgi:glutathione S-transferase